MVTSKLKDNSSLNGQLRIPVAYYKRAYFTWQCGEGAGGAAQQFDEAGRQCDEAARQCILRRHRFASLIQLLDVPVVSKLYKFSFSSTLVSVEYQFVRFYQFGRFSFSINVVRRFDFATFVVCFDGS